MRKISLIIAALALVLGLSQCKKENKPAASGETQRIVLTASNGNDGSKVNIEELSTILNLKWESTDVIMASGAVEGPLRYVSGEGCTAQFEGTVTRKEGDNVIFTVGAAPANYEDQTGDVTWIQSHLYLESAPVEYQEDGVYGGEGGVKMELQYAVLKLDLSALGPETGSTTVTISNEALETVATVTGVTKTNKVYYVAMPAAVETTYTFSGNGMNVTKTWTLANNIFYTGNTTDAAIVIAPDYLCFTAEEAGSTVKMETWNYLDLPDLEYSTDGNIWNEFVPDETTVSLKSVGDKVYFRICSTTEASAFSSNAGKYAYFVMSGKIAASGNVMSLISPDCSATKIPCNYCFYNLFLDCASLTSAPELPAENLAERCYESMFEGCASLTSAPELPAENLAERCYESMFEGCTSLEAAPELPAENLAQGYYDSMFLGCTSLEAAPKLPAQTLCQNCYNEMFSGCEKLSSITMLATNISASDCLYSFARGVSNTGTFWKARGMEEENLQYVIHLPAFNSWEFKNYEGAK